MIKRAPYRLYGFFIFVVCLNVAFWSYSKNVKAGWSNVPPAPSYLQATMSALGDPQLAYRGDAIMLTNLGSTGGDVQNFKAYNYERLADWLHLSNKLDPVSNYVPYLATYYYSAVEDGEKLRAIIPYIELAGSRPQAGRWHYLVQAIFLARHKVKDLDLALQLSERLGSLTHEDVPTWTQQMRAFVYMDQGEKQAAYDILRQIILTGRDTLPPEELYNLRLKICKNILSPEEAREDILCQD